MNINATLVGQMITFALFVWFTMKFIWPPITKAIKERQKKIADGLAAAQQGKRDLELAERHVRKIIDEAKLEASHVMERAHEYANQCIKDAKEAALEESQRILARANEKINQQLNQARQSLSHEVASLALVGAEKILGKEVNAETHQASLQQLAKELVT